VIGGPIWEKTCKCTVIGGKKIAPKGRHLAHEAQNLHNKRKKPKHSHSMKKKQKKQKQKVEGLKLKREGGMILGGEKPTKGQNRFGETRNENLRQKEETGKPATGSTKMFIICRRHAGESLETSAEITRGVVVWRKISEATLKVKRRSNASQDRGGAATKSLILTAQRDDVKKKKKQDD